MKKWTKTALLTGCACCIAGAVLMFSGWASGGKAYAETYDLNAMSGSAKKEDGISTQEKIKLDDFDELQADLTIGDLNILPSGDDSCYLAWRIPSKKGETAVEYRVRDGVLSIEETSAVSDTIYINIDFTEEILSGGKQSETGVILYVPEKKVLKKIEVTMGFGDVQMNGIQAESGRLQNADGDITLFGCDMQNIKCKADYGDVELKSGTWGEVYFKQFQGRCLFRLAFGFGGKLDAFREIMERVGAQAISSGDVGYELEFMKGLFVRLILWAGDDEFPPSAQILFSDNFPAAFTQGEDMAVVGDVTIDMLKALAAK